ncbi:MAG: methylenetetrahydrofolate reductase C-terminal domain-containing protein [Candidatus Omnitrophica bacterium]|nr:methylenetetrahydrofolate reductase C-terminal domain-containing protein [Candidatus Omnitrophota bacterium]
MVITKQKQIEKIKQFLKPKERIFIIGCGECATVCATGGEPEILKMKKLLEQEEFSITGFAIPDAPCNAVQIRKVLRENKQILAGSDSILVLACGLGAQSIKDNMVQDLAIHIGCDTLGMGQTAKNNEFPQTCVGCGDCILELTDTICPVANCAKSLMNGPCGGQNKGKCEINKEKDCAWIKIYESLKKKDSVYLLKEIRYS